MFYPTPFLYHLDADRARKHGLDEFVQADPCRFDHADLFKVAQTLTLDYRLNDAYTCLVRHLLLHGISFRVMY